MKTRLTPASLLILLAIAQQSSVCWSIMPARAQDQKLENVRAGINRGNNFMAHNLFKQALDEYEKCLDLDPENSYAKGNIILAHNNWGIYYFHQGKYDLAKKEWQEALRLNPNDHYARSNLATWQKAMSRMPQREEPESDEPPASLQPKAEPMSAVLLTPVKHSAQPNSPPPQSTQSAVPEKIQDSEVKLSKTDTSKQEPTSQPEPLSKYWDPGQSSGVKILPHKQVEPESTNSIDETIDRLETKIYGQTRNQSSVLKRLENMEVDSFGRVSSGPITDRLAKLKQLFSMP